MPLPELLTEPEAAEALKLHPRTLRKARQSGGLPHVRIGRSVRYSVADLNAFLAAATVSNDMMESSTRKSSPVSRSTRAIVPFTQRQR
jgi:excisionase family DNA binding protein